jgi:hypothetical protein
MGVGGRRVEGGRKCDAAFFSLFFYAPFEQRESDTVIYARMRRFQAAVMKISQAVLTRRKNQSKEESKETKFSTGMTIREKREEETIRIRYNSVETIERERER